MWRFEVDQFWGHLTKHMAVLAVSEPKQNKISFRAGC